MKDAGPDHCGCCGREIPGRPRHVRYWCSDCAKHVLPPIAGVRPYERTFYAQHGKPCPFEPEEVA